jgi:peptidoglycan-associated lipoprotein
MIKEVEMREVRVGQVARGGLILSLAALAGCGYAKRKDVDAQMVQLRTDMQSEMQSGDQALDGKISTLDGRVGGLESRAAALEQELRSMRTEFNASIDQLKGMLSFNVPVNFEFNSDMLRDPDHAVLRKFASVVEEYYPNAVVTVEGFTDPSGSRSYNLDLGRRRAESVKSFLVTEGLQDNTVKVVSYGEAADRQVVPGAQGPGDEGQQNRRVSLVIDYSGSPLATRPITN